MKKILFVYPAMNIGGSTTSLLSILNRLDYSKYDVDLLLNLHSGELLDMIPKQVKLLPPAYKHTNKRQEYIHRLLSPRYIYHFCKSRMIAKKTGLEIRAAQYIGFKDIDHYRNINEEYDVAISFLEGRTYKFLSKHIKAKRKITWIHINYADTNFDPYYERDSLDNMDKIVLVSKDCKRDFDKLFPEFANKSVIIENILATEFIRARAKETTELKTNMSKINLVTICRISLSHKGLDRAVSVLSKLRKQISISGLRWYIIGDGQDMEELKRLIATNDLQQNIVLLGAKNNPIPYLKDMSMFFLPSIYEGKPMAVTEAFMMGLPALVTEYSSAREQVRDGVDGIIVDNSEEGIYEGLKRIIENPEIITELHENVIQTDYSNVEEMKKVEQLIDG